MKNLIWWLCVGTSHYQMPFDGCILGANGNFVVVFYVPNVIWWLYSRRQMQFGGRILGANSIWWMYSRCQCDLVAVFKVQNAVWCLYSRCQIKFGVYSWCQIQFVDCILGALCNMVAVFLVPNAIWWLYSWCQMKFWA